jgi:Undecaprenyl-phosphate glucose phosphotransferase
MTDAVDLNSKSEFTAGQPPWLPRRLVGLVVFAGDFVMLLVSSVVSGIIYHELILGQPGDVATFFGVACAVFSYLSIFLAYRGSYSVVNLSRQLHQVREISLAWLVVFLVLVTLAFLLKVGPNLSRGATIVFFFCGWAELLCWRLLVGARLQITQAHQGFAKQMVIVVSDKRSSIDSDRLQSFEREGYGVARYVVLPTTPGEISDVSEQVLKASRCDPKIAGIFLLMDWSNPERIDQMVESLRSIPLPVRLFPDRQVARFLDNQVVTLGSTWATELQRAPLTFEERFAKRVLDIVVSLALLGLFVPLMVVVAILIKLDSRGPVFFVQTRNGFNSRPFRIFKFRTLTTLEDGPQVAQVSRRDARTTRIGRILRRTSLDELPQLINILKGEMSLVGPRPHAAVHNDYYEQLISTYAFRHHVKPGLTGWAQVSGFRGETTLDLMKQRVKRDIWYIDNWSFWLDIKIILGTCLIVLKASAY